MENYKTMGKNIKSSGIGNNSLIACKDSSRGLNEQNRSLCRKRIWKLSYAYIISESKFGAILRQNLSLETIHANGNEIKILNKFRYKCGWIPECSTS